MPDLLDSEEIKSAWRKAIHLLSYRAYFSTELRNKLKSAGFSSSVIEVILTKCREAGYLDDKERAQRMVASWTKKGYGPGRIRLELQKRGITASFPIENNLHHLALYISKHLPSDPSEQQKAKVVRALLRRGFSLDAIREAMIVV